MKISKVGKNCIEIIRNKRSGLRLVIKENRGYMSVCKDCIYANSDSCIIGDGMLLLCEEVRIAISYSYPLYFPRRED